MKRVAIALAVLLACFQTSFADENDVASIKADKIQLKKNSNKFDITGSRYYYVDADKDCQMATFDFTATSSSKNPTLPSLYISKLDDEGKLTEVAVMEVRFKKWEDLGTYLGNSPDSNNDFAKSDSVRFVAFHPVYKNGAEHVIFTDGKGCYVRIEERLKNPPVRYRDDGICSIRPPTSLDGMKVLGKVRTAKR